MRTIFQSTSIRGVTLTLLGLIWLICGSPSLADPIPSQPPEALIWNGGVDVTAEALQAEEQWLTQHLRATGERIHVLLLPASLQLDGGALTQLSHDTLHQWGVETTRRGKNALILMAWQKRASATPKVSVMAGAGMNSPKDLSSLEDDCEESLTLLGQPTPQKAVHTVIFAFLRSFESPVLSSEEFTLGRTRGTSPTDPTSQSSDSENSQIWWWLKSLLLIAGLGAAGAVFSFIFQQIRHQEVLIGAQRWVIFSPRFKLQLWLQSKRNSAPAKPGSTDTPRMVWSKPTVRKK
jgi:hypothetical protein